MAEHIRERIRIDSHSIPRYTIDLSSPPILRYQHVAKAFLPQLASLRPLFSEIIPRPFFRKLATLALHRLHSKEQTSELRGIHHVTKISMHLLVALNVLLDLMMGCTSGGVLIQNKMLHFRTLDWGMHPPAHAHRASALCPRRRGKVAECVTYLGYYVHQALVLFGLRPAIASMLRELLFARRWSPQQIERRLCETAAYLVFCDGQALEKGHRSAVVDCALEFIVLTKHDRAHQSLPSNFTGILDQIHTHGIVAESTSCKQCMAQMWEQRSGRLSPEQVGKWMDTNPMTNALTHYAVIMDPSRGTFVWEKYYPDARALWDRLNGRGGLR